MKKSSLLAVLVLLLTTNLNAQITKAVPKGFWVACGGNEVLVINPDASDQQSQIVWNWKVSEAEKQIPLHYQKLLVPLDECKLIDNNTKLLLTSSGGATCIVDIKTKKVEFYAQTPMAHSAEILSNNLIAVANSTHAKGNSLEIYHRSKPELVLAKDSLYSGHGVSWDAERQVLYALGYDNLRTYKVGFDKGNKVELTLLKTVKLPDLGGHDLSVIDKDRLLVSTHHSVFNYNVVADTFEEFEPLKKIENVKSANFDPITNTLVYTKAEESWWTFNIYSQHPTRKIHIPSTKLYKVRVAK
ncbi:DUF6528 family protein [Sphingobacterium hungaricum]|uniref:Uncharacterized protein n=1 Tax=Sphingobacterium hungaricum TaxID=2082723 RepID=A0A928UW55_9SPHI|nr:DUF6528 family protein [Sphingobacterium hungaricum]MBE8714340.1 hypothetical protein [Sphingobacterium hungaricum]